MNRVNLSYCMALLIFLTVSFTLGQEAKSESKETKLTASDAQPNKQFGLSVGISGDTAVIGAPGLVPQQVGAAYVFQRSGGVWSQEITLQQVRKNSSFGWSVATDGLKTVVGAPFDSSNGGAAYVYERRGSSWSEPAKLIAGDGSGEHVFGANFDTFGDSVALDGDTLVIGASNTDNQRGSAYVFVRSGEAWIKQTKLRPSNAQRFSDFGRAVAISDGTIVIGAPRHNKDLAITYVYRRAGSTWEIEAELEGPGSALHWFGASVAIDGDWLATGAYSDDDNGAYSGSVYVFQRKGATWTKQAKLTAIDGESEDRFGSSVAIKGRTLVVAAPGDDDAGSNSGALYVFGRVGSSWHQKLKLFASDATAEDLLGSLDNMAMDGRTAVVGAYGKNDAGNDSGAAYVYELRGVVPTTSTSWLELLLD